MAPILGSLNAFVIAYTQSDFFGKLIILGLIALSMLCWLILLYKTWIMRQVCQLSSSFQKAVTESKTPVLTLDLAQLPQARTKTTPHPFANIYNSVKQKTIEVLNKNHYFISQTVGTKAPVYLSPSDLELLESHVTATISAQNKSLEKNLYLLSTIVTLAPFMGLLGTVWGILMTFSGLQDGGAISSNHSILGGLSTALATTVMGLIIAIPALISYNYLKNALRNYASDMDDFLTLLLSNIELQYRKVE
ncbi:MAG TPA: MotA/TolQ/ExbB proton channel family protein [Rhabdochlamydiaceae bacterium]|nr:MotA/TolQ/ExbB proton channel family protein [Rhabdochlamydiaceae bacterium]